MKLSAVQRSCIIEATIEPLMLFRRGFARGKLGPFYENRTVRALVAIGALRIIHPRGRPGGRTILITARAA